MEHVLEMPNQLVTFLREGVTENFKVELILTVFAFQNCKEKAHLR